MILQRAIKGIGDIDEATAQSLLLGGITCNWWRKVGVLPNAEIPLRLTERNLDWHQNHFDDPDPDEGHEPFRIHTPFISTTAGSVERDTVARTNLLKPAWQVALEFATDTWARDGYLFHCYLFVLGRPSIPQRAFAEEIRELNLYSEYSIFQPEGEITAKVLIPTTQIEKYDFFDISSLTAGMAAGTLPTPTRTVNNPFYQPPEEIANIRQCLL